MPQRSGIPALVLLFATAGATALATLPDKPVRILICGDSKAKILADRSLPRQMAEFPNVTLESVISIGTGLARPDVFDWPVRLREVIEKNPPHFVVLLFGANDNQALRTPDGVLVAAGTPEWNTEYAARVNQVIGLLADTAVQQVLWVGLPDMRTRETQAHALRVNDIFKAACARSPKVEFLDVGALFSRTPGVFTPYILKADGMPLTVRANDGVHLNAAGSDLLGEAIRKTLEARMFPQ